MRIDERTIRLIAVGASITANCQSCLLINITIAREKGVTDVEIADAIEIGKMVREGAATKMDKFTINLGKGILQAADQTNKVCECNSK